MQGTRFTLVHFAKDVDAHYTNVGNGRNHWCRLMRCRIMLGVNSGGGLESIVQSWVREG